MRCCKHNLKVIGKLLEVKLHVVSFILVNKREKEIYNII